MKTTQLTAEELELINDFCGNEAEEIIELCESFEQFISIRNSINDDCVTLQDIIDDQFLVYKDGYFSNTRYVNLREGGVCSLEDANFCEYYEQYTEDPTMVVHIGRSKQYFSQDGIDESDVQEYNGEYYDDHALDYHGLVYVGNDIFEQDDCYYWDNEWHHEPQEKDDYVRDYHDGNHKFINFSENPKFLIGFEIEKEDYDVKISINIEDFEDETNNKWRKESDGSLDSESGFELISPAFELNVDKIFEHINENELLIDHINASKSDNCGGHINVSEIGLSGEELFDKIKGYTPLFYALYYKRIDKSYCKGKANIELKSSYGKYQAIKIHSNRVEYRIISAVPDLKTLNWRCRLIDFILNNPTPCAKEAYFNFKTTLKDLISEMYPIEEKMQKLEERLIKYILQYENITI